MLIYHPALDLHHCVFRILQLLNKLPNNIYEKDKIRIFDYYLLFPGELQLMKFPSELRTYKKQFLFNKYNNVPDTQRVFLQLEPFHNAALNYIASLNLIEVTYLKDEKVKRTNEVVPLELLEMIESSSKDKEIIDFIVKHLNNISLYGENGLKGRTTLFEYKYDPA